MLVLWSSISCRGHIRPNRKFALTSFSKSFFIFLTCFRKITGSLPKSLPVKSINTHAADDLCVAVLLLKKEKHLGQAWKKTCTCTSCACTSASFD